ncbi:MAG TPA: site-specific DNA-methyltransferase [Acidimicrobiales bacterium]|nr:site-specific DNA-methyltransferase [Acidimicrobiales bacterium]
MKNNQTQRQRSGRCPTHRSHRVPGTNHRPILPDRRILVGDALAELRRLPTDSIDTVVTSPPYFLLRNYGVAGQLGAGASVEHWIAELRAVLTEVGRVLKPEGTLWLNLGDTYSRTPRHGAPAKSLLLGPERLLVGLLADGWRVRNKVVWAKTSAMPSSVGDRLSSRWEPLYLLTRSHRYFFDLDAIREPARSRARPSQGTGGQFQSEAKKPDWAGPGAGSNSGLAKMRAQGLTSHPLGKNPGDVWSLATAGYRSAHFATFPEGLVERPLLATCPERVCRRCGRAWRRANASRRLGSLAVRGELRKSCPCPSRSWQPGLVLDPFMGAGTVGVVAQKLHRRWLGIELNPDFARLAEERIQRTVATGGSR